MGDIIVGFCLDQSGSMETWKKEAVDGFNAFKEEQASLDGSAYLTLVLFDTQPLVRYRGGLMKQVYDLGSPGVNPYIPSGGTALYDAVDVTIGEVERWLAENASFDGTVLVAIFTDGQENSSQQVTIERLNDRIRDKKELGWEFVFMGAGGASWTEGRSLAAAGVGTVNFAAAPGNVSATYGAFTTSVTQGRMAGAPRGATTTSFLHNAADLQADVDLHQSNPDSVNLNQPGPDDDTTP
jgi:hypothetical protein